MGSLPGANQPIAHRPGVEHAPAVSGMNPASERLQWPQLPAAAPLQPPDATDTGAACPEAAKRQAVLRQVRAQREALALLSRNAPVPALLLRDVGPPTADFDPAVSMQAPSTLPHVKPAPP